MLFAGSYRHSLHPMEKETLALMDKDVEDEEFSDAESLEEITAEDFNSRSRVLSPDQMKHPLTGDFFARDGFELPPAAPASIKEVPLVVVIEDSSDDSGGESEEEEDEIELGLESESVAKKEPVEVESEEKQSEEMWDLDKSVKRIVETLAAITSQEVETSFDRVCSLLRKSFEILKQSFPESSGPLIGSLVQLAFMTIQTVHSVTTSRAIEMEQNDEFLLRFLVQIKSQYSSGLTPDELKQLDVQIRYWTSVRSEKELHSGSEGSTSGTSHCSISSEKPCMEEPQEANSGFSNGEKAGLPKLAAPLDFGTKVGTFSLYDTHALQAVSSYQQKHTHALQAVSSYQQKHSLTSLVALATNRLPSPTPSEECEDKNCADGEVSSPSVVDSVSLLLPLGPSGSVACTTSNGGLEIQMAPVNSDRHQGVATDSSKKALAKSRDPRLRIIDSEMDLGGIPVPNRHAGGLMDPRKHKAADDILDTRPSKRHRNGFSSSGDVATDDSEMDLDGIPVPNGCAGGLMDPRKHKAADDILDTRPSKLQRNGFSSLGDVVTDDSACHTTLFSNENGLIGTVSSNVPSMMLSEPDRNPAGKIRLTSPSASMNPTNDDGRTHCRHRDPRDILRNCRILESGSSKSEPANTSGNLLSDTRSHKDHFIVREQGEQAQAPSLPSHPMPLPGVAQPFLKNLKSIVRVISSSSRSTNTKVNGKSPAADSNDQKNASVSLCEGGGTKDTSEKQVTCEHVDQLLDGYNDEEKATILKERARRIEEQKKMFEARKLCLVLDLDHTLLNSVMASKLYELHLCTMGNKIYAAEMAKLLDPTGTLFAGRVISRGDSIDSLDGGDEMVPRVKDLDGVLGMESAVVIIDDSAKVWPHNQLNLITVERYTYFPFSRRQFELPGPSLLEIGFDERSEDGTLASTLAVIERIHRNFFSNSSLSNVDVRGILASEQQKILSGCRIVFSRIFPTGEMKPHRHPLWITARRFGAECTDKIDERVTHVVANSPGTDKVKWAMANGKFVVKRGWVEASAFLYRRASEQTYAIKVLPEPSGRPDITLTTGHQS